MIVEKELKETEDKLEEVVKEKEQKEKEAAHNEQEKKREEARRIRAEEDVDYLRIVSRDMDERNTKEKVDLNEDLNDLRKKTWT